MPAEPGPEGGGQDVIADLETRLREASGTVIGTSTSFRITQPEEDAFAALIGDWDPMHNDPAWRMSAGDGPIVLGFHALARVENDLRHCRVVSQAAGSVRMRTVGLGKVRFPAPFPVGAPARSEISVADVSPHAPGLALTTTHRYRVVGASKPVMVAELVTLITRKDQDLAEQPQPPAPDAAGTGGDPVLLRDLPDGDPIAVPPRYDTAFYESLASRGGQWLGSTPWTCISDREAHAFALLAGDDGTCAGGDVPSRAHPFLAGAVSPLQLLALRAYFSPMVGLPVLTDESMMALNYGVDHARWHGSVRARTKLRDHVQLLGTEARRPGDYLVTTRHVLEAEGSDAAVLVAQCKTLYRTSS